MKTYSKMKDSGVNWIGEIPKEWNIKKLKFLVLNRSTKSKYFDLPYVGLENIETKTGVLINFDDEMNKSEAKIFQKDDVLFGKLRPYLAKVSKMEFIGCCSSEFLVLQGKEYLGKFLQFLLLSDGSIETINASTYGSKMPRAEWQFIGNMKFPHLAIETQIKIIDFLEKQTNIINLKISKNQKLIQLMKEKKQTTINYVVTNGLDPFAPMKDSGVNWIGEIPEHWEIFRLSWITKNINDIDHKMPEAIDNGIPFLSAKDLVDGNKLNFEKNIKYISEDDFERLSRKIKPLMNDIIYSRIGSIGKARLVKVDKKFLVSYSCCIIRVNDRLILPEYCCNVLDTDFLLTEAKQRTQGIGVPDLGLNEIGRFPIPIPPINEQKKILELLNEEIPKFDTIILNSKKLIEKLQAYRKSLISSAVTGKIDVRGVVA